MSVRAMKSGAVDFVDTVRDIVRLYLNPPDHALAICVDEKMQIQTLDRRQPMLPLVLGHIEGGSNSRPPAGH